MATRPSIHYLAILAAFIPSPAILSEGKGLSCRCARGDDQVADRKNARAQRSESTSNRAKRASRLPNLFTPLAALKSASDQRNRPRLPPAKMFSLAAFHN
jgi:hypothetical protein